MRKSIGLIKMSLLLSLCISLLPSCSKEQNQAEAPASTRALPVETPKLENSALVDCKFQTDPAVYTYGTTITPNPIVCKEGVAKFVTLLSPTALPLGLSVTAGTLSLMGTANEKANPVKYIFYLENEVGYVKIPLTLSVK